MDIYFAPMEGITGYVYRNVHHRFYGHIAEYYTPFIVPNQARRLTSREMNDILPEHNRGLNVVPQILANRAEDFVWAAHKAKTLGYGTVNLNLGCPSGTVVSKGRGAGFLADPEALERFLEEVSAGLGAMGIRLSVKTRIGMGHPEEFVGLLRVFNQYPLEKLIIHPRVRTDYYRNHPNMEAFREAALWSVNPVCYNGDIFSVKDFTAFHKAFPEVGSVMAGRGLLTNPALAAEIESAVQTGQEASGGQVLQTCPPAQNRPEWSGIPAGRRLKEFHDALLEGYREVIPGDKNVLFKMKELWFYLAYAFDNGERLVKKIRKARSMEGYVEAVGRLFEEQRPAECPVFPGTA